MRLFLASENLGDYADEYRRLVGDGRKLLVITNARDYYEQDRRDQKVADTLTFFRENGFEPTELDLRPYFGKTDELNAYIEEFQPDVIFRIGGNCFLLNTAFKLSGMGQIIRDGVASDKFVYSGYSAGSMVASKTLKYFGHGHLTADAVPEIYGVDAVVDSLGLIDEYIVPHADVPKHAEATKMYVENVKQAGDVPIVLNQSSVYLINGEDKRVLQ